MSRPLRFLLLIVCFSGCDSTINLDDPTLNSYVKFYGGDGDQYGVDMEVLPDGSTILFGTTRPSAPGSPSQWYLAKVDNDGKLLWERTDLGGSLDDEARDIEISGPDEVILLGNTTVAPGDRDLHLLRISFDGIIRSETIFGLPGGTDEDGSSVSVTSDGFIVAGSTTNVSQKGGALSTNDVTDLLQVRFYTDLTVPYPASWAKVQGYDGNDRSIKLVEYAPSLFYGFASTNANLSIPAHVRLDYNFMTYKLGSTGIPSSQTPTIGSVQDIYDEVLSSVAVVTDGTTTSGMYLSGYQTNSTNGNTDIFFTSVRSPLVLDVSDLVISKPLSIPLGQSITGGTSVTPSKASGGFYLLANENSATSNQNWLLGKYDLAGTLIWQFPITFGGEGLDLCGAVKELPDGRIVLLGTMRTGRPDAGEFKMTMIKVSQDGKFK